MKEAHAALEKKWDGLGAQFAARARALDTANVMHTFIFDSDELLARLRESLRVVASLEVGNDLSTLTAQRLRIAAEAPTVEALGAAAAEMARKGEAVAVAHPGSKGEAEARVALVRQEAKRLATSVSEAQRLVSEAHDCETCATHAAEWLAWLGEVAAAPALCDSAADTVEMVAVQREQYAGLKADVGARRADVDSTLETAATLAERGGAAGSRAQARAAELRGAWADLQRKLTAREAELDAARQFCGVMEELEALELKQGLVEGELASDSTGKDEVDAVRLAEAVTSASNTFEVQEQLLESCRTGGNALVAAGNPRAPEVQAALRDFAARRATVRAQIELRRGVLAEALELHKFRRLVAETGDAVAETMQLVVDAPFRNASADDEVDWADTATFRRFAALSQGLRLRVSTVRLAAADAVAHGEQLATREVAAGIAELRSEQEAVDKEWAAFESDWQLATQCHAFARSVEHARGWLDARGDGPASEPPSDLEDTRGQMERAEELQAQLAVREQRLAAALALGAM